MGTYLNSTRIYTVEDGTFEEVRVAGLRSVRDEYHRETASVFSCDVTKHKFKTGMDKVALSFDPTSPHLLDFPHYRTGSDNEPTHSVVKVGGG